MSEKNQPKIDTSFLQVTINSNKLMGMLDSIVKQLSENTADLRMVKQVIPTIKSSVQNNLQMTEARIQLQSQRLQQKLKADLHIQASQLRQMIEDGNKNHKNLASKVKQNQQNIKKMEQDRKRIDANIKCLFDQLNTKQAKAQQDCSQLERRIEENKQKMNEFQAKFDDQFEMVLLKVQSLLKNNIKANIKSQSSSFRRGQIKKPAPSTNINWAHFSHKINQLQRKMQGEKQNNQYIINKVLYPKQRKQALNYSATQQWNEQKSPDVKNCLDSIMAFMLKFNQEIDALKSKCLVLDEKNNINCRKIDKQSQKLTDIKGMLKKNEDKRSDDQLIDILRNQFLQKMHQVEEDLEKKVYRDQYDKDKTKIHQKILILQENFVEKADKGEMKKAFLFLEDKIKQIIILMAGEQGQEKDGAIRKIPMKCLSCDKHIQNEGITTSRPPSPLRDKDSQSRSVSRNIRKRVHIGNTG